MKFIFLICISILPAMVFAEQTRDLGLFGTKKRLNNAYQADKSKKSIFSNVVKKKINSRRKISAYNNAEKPSQRALGNIGNIAVGSVREGEDIGKTGTDNGVYHFGQCSLSGSGVGDVTILNDGCSGSTFVGGVCYRFGNNSIYSWARIGHLFLPIHSHG